MLSVEQQKWATELLQTMSWEDLQSLSRTVTNGLIVVENRKEAYSSILLHTQDIDELLSRQKISREIMFAYLHSKHISCPKKEKVAMKVTITNLWQGNATQFEITSTSSNNTAPPPNNDNSSTEGQDETLNELAMKFAPWFYNLLNESKSEPGGCMLGSEHFFEGCSVKIHLKSPANSDYKEVLNNAEGVARILVDTKSEFHLFFNPNLSADGVQGKMDPHGLVLVLACGTLHVGNKCVGIFEQVFALAKDPFSENNWKIKNTTLYLKSQDLVAGVPALKDSQLALEFT